MVSCFLVLEQPGDLSLQGLELMGIAEELRDADQEVLEKTLDLLAVCPQTLDIGLEGVDLQHLHPSLHPTGKGPPLVAMEVMAGDIAKNGGDLRDVSLHLRRQFAFGIASFCLGNAGGMERDVLCDVVHEQIEIHEGGRVRAPVNNTAIVPIDLFRDGKAAELLGRRHTGEAVSTQAGQDDRNRMIMRLFGKGDQHGVYRTTMTNGFGGRTYVQTPVLDRHHVVGTSDIDPIWKKALPV